MTYYIFLGGNYNNTIYLFRFFNNTYDLTISRNAIYCVILFCYYYHTSMFEYTNYNNIIYTLGTFWARSSSTSKHGLQFFSTKVS